MQYCDDGGVYTPPQSIQSIFRMEKGHFQRYRLFLGGNDFFLACDVKMRVSLNTPKKWLKMERTPPSPNLFQGLLMIKGGRLYAPLMSLMKCCQGWQIHVLRTD